jgi:hypothetical protein
VFRIVAPSVFGKKEEKKRGKEKIQQHQLGLLGK